MTTSTIRNGSTVQVPIAIGETLKVVAVSGTFTATVTQGTGQGTVLATGATGGSYGPYAYASMVGLVSSAHSEVDFDVAVSPAIESDTVAKFNIDPLTGVLTLVGPNGVVPLTSPITTPVGFRGTALAPALDLRRLGGSIVTNFDITSQIPTVTNIWYVDPVNGNDGTAIVNTRANPLLNLATALAKTDVDQIRIINLTANYVGRIAKSWNNIIPTRSLSLVVEGNFRYISAKAASSVAPTWTVNGTYGNVYQCTISAANSNQVVDFSKTSQPTITLGADATAAQIAQVASLSVNAPPVYLNLTTVASIAAVAAAAGTWFNDGTNTYVRASDDRSLIGDGNMQPLTNGVSNGRFPNALSGANVYVQGVDFVGGIPFQMLVGGITAATGGVSGTAVITTASTANVQNGMNITGTGVPAGTTVLSFVANTSITISQNLTTTASGNYSTNYSGVVAAFNKCSFQSSAINGGSSSNALAVAALASIYSYRCGAYYSGADGFNYHLGRAGRRLYRWNVTELL